MAKRRRAHAHVEQNRKRLPLSHTTPDPVAFEKLLTILKDLESRVAHIELSLGLGSALRESDRSTPSSLTRGEESEDALETRVGETWFAKVGIVVLAFGVIFLLTFPYQNLPSFAPSAIGYVLVGVIFSLSRYWKDSYRQVSRYLLAGGMLLLYFTTLRLFHFGPEPFLTSISAELGLLLLVVIINVVVASREKSPYLIGINIVLGLLTSLVGGGAYIALSFITASVIAFAWYAVRYRWSPIATLGITLSYLAHSLWSMHILVFVNLEQQIPEINLLFILVYITIFASVSLIRSEKEKEDVLFVTDSVLNGCASCILLIGLAFTAFRTSFALWSLLGSGVYLVIAIAFWVRTQSKYATFIYAMLGYAVLSAAIVDLSAAPDVFVWLCWQSVLVLSTAVWFRSRFIVVTNFAIFLMTFVAYLFLAGTVGVISVSFGIVALLSARILNWQKGRLELKTEMMRNAYLASALFVFPYALYHVVPRNYVSSSWLILALFYYLISRFLNKNRKYRWMALLTVILTVLYVFVIDLVAIDPVLRVVSFLVLGISLLGVSMIYSKRSRRNGTKSFP